METSMERNLNTVLKKVYLSAAILAAVIAVMPLTTSAGTRMIPPPPPNHANDNAVDGIVSESTWGVYPGQNDVTTTRREAMRDDEGTEINFNHNTDFGDNIATYRRRNTNRAPAGLEVSKTTPVNPSDEGWKSKPNDDNRHTAKEADASNGKRPVLKRVSRTEEAHQDAVTEKFITDVSDPIARRKGVQEISIIAGDLGFFPKTIFVSRDVPVRLFVTGATKGSLCIMMDSFNVRKQIRTSKIEEITFTPNQPGTYRFYCPVNGSEGTMVVKELTTNSVPGEG